MIVVSGDVIARSRAQALKDFLAPQNLTYGVRRQPVEVDDAFASIVRAAIALRPLSDVAVESYGREVTSRREVHRVAIGNEIREREVARVGMIHQLAETDRESSYGGRHQQISTRCRLRATLQRAIVHGSHLVGMVREIGGRTGIIEREHAANQQARLMVRCREGTAEGSASLAVRHIAVGKEHAGRRRESIAYVAGFAHEAVFHLHGVDDGASIGDDGVFTNDACTDEHRVRRRRTDGTVAQSGSTADLAAVVDDRVRDFLRVDNLHVIADGTTIGNGTLYLLVDHPANGILQRLVVEVLHHESGKLTVQVAEQNQVALAHLVEH